MLLPLSEPHISGRKRVINPTNRNAFSPLYFALYPRISENIVQAKLIIIFKGKKTLHCSMKTTPSSPTNPLTH